MPEKQWRMWQENRVAPFWFWLGALTACQHTPDIFVDTAR